MGSDRPRMRGRRRKRGKKRGSGDGGGGRQTSEGTQMRSRGDKQKEGVGGGGSGGRDGGGKGGGGTAVRGVEAAQFPVPPTQVASPGPSGTRLGCGARAVTHAPGTSPPVGPGRSPRSAGTVYSGRPRSAASVSPGSSSGGPRPPPWLRGEGAVRSASTAATGADGPRCREPRPLRTLTTSAAGPRGPRSPSPPAGPPRPGLTAFLALLHHRGVRLPLVILELEEAVQVLQVRYLPLQALHLRLVLRHLLVRPLLQQAHLGLGLLPGRGQPGSGRIRVGLGSQGWPGTAWGWEANGAGSASGSRPGAESDCS